VIQFNATGGGFSAAQNPNIFNVSQFTYDPGSELAVGAVTAINNFNAHSGATTFQVYFQSALGGIGATPVVPGQGVNINLNVPVPPGSANQPPGGNGDIKVVGGTPTDTGKMITLVGTFTEQVLSVNVGASTTAYNFGLAPVQNANNVTLYAIAANSANESTGAGFVGTPAQAILTGTVTSGIPGFAFSSSFGGIPNSGQGSQSNPVPFDQYTQTNPPYVSPFGALNSVSGTGGVALPVVVSSVNANWFQTSPSITALTFPNFGAGLPFTTNPPAQSVDGVTALGTLGTVNGSLIGGGSNIEFLTQGSNNFSSFVIPEPSTLMMATISIGFVSAAACFRSRRRRN
jgi:hypothetical protein